MATKKQELARTRVNEEKAWDRLQAAAHAIDGKHPSLARRELKAAAKAWTNVHYRLGRCEKHVREGGAS